MTGIEKETQRGEMTKGRRSICPQRIVFFSPGLLHAAFSQSAKRPSQITSIGFTEDCFLSDCALLHIRGVREVVKKKMDILRSG